MEVRSKAFTFYVDTAR